MVEWTRSSLRRAAASAAWMVLAALAPACGGGGGSGSSGSGSAGIDSTADYYPLNAGDRWVYEVTITSSTTPLSPATMTMQVSSSKSVLGQTASVVSTSGDAYGGTDGEDYIVKNASGVSILDPTATAAALSSYQVFKLPMVVGDSYTPIDTVVDAGYDADGDGRNETIRYVATVRVVAVEAVTAAIGRVAGAVRIDSLFTGTMVSSRTGVTLNVSEGTLREWYAPNIGLVVRDVSSSFNHSTPRTVRYSLAAYDVAGHRSETAAPTVTAAQTSTLGDTVSVTMIEALDASSVNASTVWLLDGNGQRILSRVFYADKTIILRPDATLTGAGYTAVLSTGVRDLAGNTLAQEHRWGVTVDTEGPVVLSTSPADRARDVPPSTAITVTFDEDLDPATVSPESIWLSGEGVSVPVTVRLVSPRVVEIAPASALQPETTYSIGVLYKLQDRLGNVAGVASSSFSTGGGAFRWPVLLNEPVVGEAVATGDVNGDGLTDVIVAPGAVWDKHALLVYLQRTDGTLATPIKHDKDPQSPMVPTSVVVGDVNGDGRADVVVGSSYGMEVFLQDASGALSSREFRSVSNARMLRLADLNHDGLLDLVGVGWGTGQLRVWWQSASGVLPEASAVTYSLDHGGPEGIALGDVNNDGLVDVVVVGQPLRGSKPIAVLHQLPGGGMGQPLYLSGDASGGASTVAVGDLNGDGMNDIAVGSVGSLGVYYRQANGSFGTLATVFTVTSGEAPVSVQVADMDADGRADLVLVRRREGRWNLYRQRADGTLSSAEGHFSPDVWSSNPNVVAVGDVNSDGRLDLVFALDGLGVVYGQSIAVTRSSAVRSASTAAVDAARTAMSTRRLRLIPAGTAGAR